VYRAALGPMDFSLFLVGATGRFKTALAALCQQHFGATLDASGLPASFASTGNALEGLVFHAKDALVVVDDFVPSGRPGEGELQRVAERLFRGAGNRQGRSRMGGDGRLRAPQPPRALVLGTGEAVPTGRSLRARLLVVEVGPGDVDRARLSECQRLGGAGWLAAAMGAFVGWMARDYPDKQQRLHARALELRDQCRGGSGHARTPTAVAELQSGWELFLDFGVEVGAIGRQEQEELAQRSWRALGELGARQAHYQAGSDPARRFVCLLQAALVGGAAHVADRQGQVPANAEAWGWKRRESGRGWVPRGHRIGWVVGNHVFLEPTASYQVAQELAGVERLEVSERTLHHRLRAGGLLASTDAGRQMVQVRRIVEGRRRQVLHLKARDVVGPVAV
jgi:hypothetical protein